MRASTVIAFVFSLLVQVGFPLAVTLAFRRKSRAPWQPFAIGAAVYAVFQLFTWLPISVYLDATVEAGVSNEVGAFVWLLTMGLLTSLIEEGGRWCGFRYLFRRFGCRLDWQNGVMCGLGHGAVETALFMGGLTFVYLLAYVVLANRDLASIMQELSASDALALREALQSIVDTKWTQPATVAIERVLALPQQVAWSLLVMQSVAMRQKRWFGFAVLFHASVAIIIPGLARLSGFFLAETINLCMAAFSLVIIYRLQAVSAQEPAASR